MRKWEIMINDFLATLTHEDRALYASIIDHLISLEYFPQKKRVKGLVLSFVNLAHNRVMAHVGMREGSEEPFFGLRFSACSVYSEKFAQVVHDRLLSSGNRPAKCASCGFCKGSKHVYTYRFPDGTQQASCGAFVLEIPHIKPIDLDEIKRLIDEQHAYFMANYVAGK